MPLASGGRVLEQAVHPRVVVGVEREGRGVDAAAAGGVGDHRAGRAVAGRAALEQVEPLLQRRRCVAAMRSRRARRRSAPRARLASSCSISALQLADVLLAPLVVDRVVGRHDQADRGDLAAAAAGAVAAGGGVVVGAVEHQALDVAAGAGGAVDEARRRVRRAAQEFEAGLQLLEQRLRPARARPARRGRRRRCIPGSRVHFHGSIADRIEAAGARLRLLHGVEERPRPRHRIDAPAPRPACRNCACTVAFVDVEPVGRLRPRSRGTAWRSLLPR